MKNVKNHKLTQAIVMNLEDFTELIEKITNGLATVEFEFGAYITSTEEDEIKTLTKEMIITAMSKYFDTNVISWHSDTDDYNPMVYICYDEHNNAKQEALQINFDDHDMGFIKEEVEKQVGDKLDNMCYSEISEELWFFLRNGEYRQICDAVCSVLENDEFVICDPYDPEIRLTAKEGFTEDLIMNWDDIDKLAGEERHKEIISTILYNYDALWMTAIQKSFPDCTTDTTCGYGMIDYIEDIYHHPRKSYLVYEKNYITGGDMDCVEEGDMRLFSHKNDALKEMYKRYDEYSKEDYYAFMKNESRKDCYVFAENLSPNGNDRDGEFHVCLVALPMF